jgi:hypothetical protein
LAALAGWALWIAGTGPALAVYLPLVDKTVQVLGYGVHQAPDHPGEFTCLVFVGYRGLEGDNAKDVAAHVNLADQAFEELIGPECRSEALVNSEKNKALAVQNARLFVGGRIVVVSNRVFGDDLARGVFDRWFRVDYRRVDGAAGVAFDLDAQGHASPQYADAEFKRVSQPDIPVEPSHREPNMIPVPTEIAPGVSIGFENKWDIAYAGDRKPTMLVQYQTDVPIRDRAASAALAAQVVSYYGAARLAAGELKSIRVGAYNEPKRSRFHFRLDFDYGTDEKGNVRYPKADAAFGTGSVSLTPKDLPLGERRP